MYDHKNTYNHQLPHTFYFEDPFKPVVVSQPYRELHTKSLADDFYSNLIDWSGDKVYFAIEDSLFCHNFYKSNTVLVKTFNDSIITSLKSIQNSIFLGTNSGDLFSFNLDKLKSDKFSYHKSRIGVLGLNKNDIITGSRDKRIKVIDFRSGKIIETIMNHTQEVCGMDLNKTKTYLATGGNDNKLFIYDYRKLNTPLKKCTEHKAAIKAISWSPNNSNQLVTGGGTADKTVKLWDINISKSGSCNNGNGSRYEISNPTLNTSSYLNPHTQSCLIKSIDYTSQICNIKWLKSNHILTTHGYSKDDIRLCSLFNFKFQKQFLGHKNRVIHFSVSPDEKYFVTGSADCSIKFWEIEDKVEEFKIR
ncbi:APC/C activator protein CDH1 [Nosema bombycis CQ1]|uniref:APC/C activator protein CDH1 n=1 Tax=Nosema bombycis (strain CQ1 / CVCC 102059) TaxID=578461 RepID=R0M322_NOSB1|nr:APC/C activator protein CDH1 [Nosema bombycis CQ1]|eukprot:EOB12389.1 APC/C activator protein CDH1 [Nosema bombycis CQ1]